MIECARIVGCERSRPAICEHSIMVGQVGMVRPMRMRQIGRGPRPAPRSRPPRIPITASGGPLLRRAMIGTLPASCAPVAHACRRRCSWGRRPDRGRLIQRGADFSRRLLRRSPAAVVVRHRVDLSGCICDRSGGLLQDVRTRASGRRPLSATAARRRGMDVDSPLPACSRPLRKFTSVHIGGDYGASSADAESLRRTRRVP